MFLFVTSIAWSADVNINWIAVSDATGYKVYMSTDLGTTWDAGTDVGNVTTYRYEGIGSYDTVSEVIRYELFVGYNGDWLPLKAPSGVGVSQ